MLSNTSDDYPKTGAEECHIKAQSLIFVTVYIIVFVAGLILNVIALVVFSCHCKTRSYTIVYMTNLAVADMLLVCTLPLRIYYHLGFSGLSQGVCEVASIVLLINMYSSIFLLTLMSVDRCLAVCFPMSAPVHRYRKRVRWVCLSVWAFSVGSSVVVYFRKIWYRAEEQRSCFGGFPVFATQTVALSATLTTGFGIPMVLMSLSSWGLIRALGRSTAAQTADLIDSNKIKRMIVVNLAIFLICFLPYHLTLALLYIYKNQAMSTACSLVSAYRYSLMLACLNALLDPLAYYFTTQTFREKIDMDAVRRLWPLHSQSSDGNIRSRVL